MEHLDLAGFITTPTHWTTPTAFDQQDAIYLSSSRQMLEPILEETSEDEEHAQNSWSPSEQISNVWSSAESETGSVIRIELTKDADSISERDFACPAKRPRRSDEYLSGLSGNCCTQPSSLDDTVLLRRFQRSNDAYDGNSLERFLACELQFGAATSRDSLSQHRSSTGSRRFDDFYSDSDSLSYHSLSRSSSLIQFESLERQMLQDQHSSLTSLGNSSPSVLSFEGACLNEENRKSNGDVGSGGNSGSNSGNNSRRGSQSSLLRRFESADGRLHQTYYDLDKLNFDENEETVRRISVTKSSGHAEVNAIAEVKSDSESSTSSSSSSGNSILNAAKPSADEFTVSNCSSSTAARIAAFQRGGGSKNSVENLSEDSGYCEPSTLRRTKSKSIPKNFEKFCEEEEFFTEHEHKPIETIDDVLVDAFEDDDREADDNDSDARNTHSKNSTIVEHDLCQPKIAPDATFVVSSTSVAASVIAPTEAHSWFRYENIKNSNAREPQQQPLPQPELHLPQYPTNAKQARSLAHSPSPVSDAGSTSSNASSSCASASSFTWLPAHSPSCSREQGHMTSLNNTQRQRRLSQSPEFFSEQLRNSLPDIREVNGSLGDYFDQEFSAATQKNGYIENLSKEESSLPLNKQRLRSPLVNDSDTANSNESTSSTFKRSSVVEAHNGGRGQAKGQHSVGGGGCGRVSSVPNELDAIGGSKTRSRVKQSKSATIASSAPASSESELTDDDDFFDCRNLRIYRSCSLNERSEQKLQTFAAGFEKCQATSRQGSDHSSGKPLETQSLGFMNASYRNLTLLDYTESESGLRQRVVYPSGSNAKMEPRKSSEDYESIICKGNFLLDELSEIYDRNVSILNDQQLEMPEKLEEPNKAVGNFPVPMKDGREASESPKAPPRLRINASSSACDNESTNGVQMEQAQVMVRLPPARQRHGRRQEAPSSLLSDTSVGSAGKTFDQDPTNLRTSYAQSLEKCNFDAKELSATASPSPARCLPKRRFQSHAAINKKRNLVSSTPNLNAYDPCGDEVEDDIYVSSAHTSMHQLPQGATQKPLGILLPIGSRSSFGKEVSFCPVVSKYSWQEQSSEECNEPATAIVETGGKEGEDTDDELLDNADATVIFNTKENEMIATRYAETQSKPPRVDGDQKEKESADDGSKEICILRESVQQRVREVAKEQLPEREPERVRREPFERQRAATPPELVVVEKVRATIVKAQNIASVETSHADDNNSERSREKQSEKLVLSDRPSETAEVTPAAIQSALVSHKAPTNVVTNIEQADNAQTGSSLKFKNNVNSKTRPVSLHLPILSEPPTNRAHVLYASQQLIDNLSRQQPPHQHNFSESVTPQRTQSATNLSSKEQKQQQQGQQRPEPKKQGKEVENKVPVSRMSNLTVKCNSEQQPGVAALDQTGMKHYNNNNELLKSKFKADEKHPSSKGFLSRFANGFRFSLRRNKKKQQQQLAGQQALNVVLEKSAESEKSASKEVRNSKITSSKSDSFKAASSHKQTVAKQDSPDFIYIPLKGPLPADVANRRTGVSCSSTSANDSNASTATLSLSSSSSGRACGNKQHVSQSKSPALTPMVTGKPPLPKQPPRLMEKLTDRRQSASGPAHQSAANCQLYSGARPTTINECFLDSERSFYDDFHNQFISGMHANGRLLDSVSMDPNAADSARQQYEFSSPSRGSVSQKTQMFNNLSNGKVYVKNTTTNAAAAATNIGPRVGGVGGAGDGGAGCKIGLIETNLDTHETVISGKTRSLMELGPQQQQLLQQQQQQRFKFIKRSNAASSGVGQEDFVGGLASAIGAEGDDDDDDDASCHIEDVVTADGSIVVVKGAPQAAGQIVSVRRPHKSMEFLLDKENQKNILPPENELKKSHDHNPNALSEHQLRVQASLQRLNIPEWFRQYNQTTARSPDGGGGGPNSYKPGNFTRKRASESSGRWTGLNSKTTSLSSLGSQRSDRSPLLLSPSAHSHHGGQTSAGGGGHQPLQHHAATGVAHGSGAGGGTFSRWSTSHLNSSQTSPSCSQRSSFSRGGPVNSSFMSVTSGQSALSTVRSSFRQPYLGWRSQEKLSQPRTPHERLASSLLATQTRPSCSTPKTTNGSVKQLPVTPEIQTSIKEVTSAIVHYVNDQTQQQQQQRSRSASPNSRKCWLESSFVGTRPLDSPQTPVIETTTTFDAAATAAAAVGLNQFHGAAAPNIYSYNYNNNINSSFSSSCYNNSSATSSIYSATATTGSASANTDVLRMNGLNCGGVAAPERSLSSASLEDVLASLLGLSTNTAGTGASASEAHTRATTGDIASESSVTLRHMPQSATPTSLKVDTGIEQRLRRRSEGDAPKQQPTQQQQKQSNQPKQQPQQKPPAQQQQQQQQLQLQLQQAQFSHNAKINQTGCAVEGLSASLRRVSLGDSSDSNKTMSELQIKCRNTKCDQSAPPADAKKYYKSCHNCSHLYCSRECRRAHWEKHRKACLHSRASNLCRQVLATCKDDLDSQRHLSMLARKGSLAQGRGVVRVLFRSAESAEGFIKHGFQCMGEASYVRWPDLMPAEMGLELYSELLKLSTEYKPDSKMLIYVAICVVSEAPGTSQAPVKWERQLVSRCAKLKLCKTVLAELEQQMQALQQPITLVAVPEPATEILILTFTLSAHTSRREVILSNILNILSRRGVLLRKHYPEIYQRLQTYADGQTDKFQPVTLHPRDSQTGQSFVCIIMPLQSESGIMKMPSVADGGNRVNTIDVGSANALTKLIDDVEVQS